MERLEVSGTVRPIYGSLGRQTVKRFWFSSHNFIFLPEITSQYIKFPTLLFRENAKILSYNSVSRVKKHSKPVFLSYFLIHK